MSLRWLSCRAVRALHSYQNCLIERRKQFLLYSECGKIPIKYLIKIRRLLFYWHILHLDKKELLFKFLLAQTLKPSKNYWVLTIKQDLKEIDLNMNEEEIFKMTSEKFKAIVLSKVNNCVK